MSAANCSNTLSGQKKITMNIKHGLIQDVDFGVDNNEHSLDLTQRLANQKLYLVKWKSCLRDQKWKYEVAFFERTLPRRIPTRN